MKLGLLGACPQRMPVVLQVKCLFIPEDCVHLLYTSPLPHKHDDHMMYNVNMRISSCICSEFMLRNSRSGSSGRYIILSLEGEGADGWQHIWSSGLPQPSPEPHASVFCRHFFHLSSLKFHSQPHPRALNYGNSSVMELLVINQYTWPEHWTHNINYYNFCGSFGEQVCGRGPWRQSSQSLGFLRGWLRLVLRRKWAGGGGWCEEPRAAWMAERWGLRWWGNKTTESLQQSGAVSEKTARLPSN